MKVIVSAPENPYRAAQVDVSGIHWEAERGIAARSVDESGPGMVAGDLDRMCRQHYRDGFAAAERDANGRIDEMQGHLARAFDEGYTQGRVEPARGLAADIRRRGLDLHFELQRVELAAKTRAKDHVPALRQCVDELIDFAEALMQDRDRAAAQVARDEG